MKEQRNAHDPEKNHGAALVWFRRDLRTHDHAALYHALKHAASVHCVFVFDTEILDRLADREDRRVEFILASLEELARGLEKMGGGLLVRIGRARELIPALASELGVSAVYANHDYEPLARQRDADVQAALARSGCEFLAFKDQAIFDKDEILTQAGRPFTVFTPYKNAWRVKLAPFFIKAYPVGKYRAAFSRNRSGLPTLAELGFRSTNLKQMKLPTGMSGALHLLDEFLGRIDDYRERRNYPGIRGVSYLSVHLRFGTISIRELVRAAVARGGEGAQTWLSELVWRDFYFSILYHFPHVAGHAFKPAFDNLQFSNSTAHFEAWCEGRTGYPLVDAAMRQLNQSGYMHNRLRMVAASFLVKDLHVDWRWGEDYFADKLNDFDLAANNGGWQWSASTGCDAQPWFRIFNPVTQSRTFDAQGRFIRLYVPELARVDAQFIHEPWTMPLDRQRAAGVEIGRDYPRPIVDHAAARLKTLEIYGKTGKS
ncbi:MAG TPA: deoxyribodipyrimidine photo-lyase [Burkholderiales bacterium]|nr:deoxyribodipyrimidine photo-lyase [Burkholderiales bacterium]